MKSQDLIDITNTNSQQDTAVTGSQARYTITSTNTNGSINDGGENNLAFRAKKLPQIIAAFTASIGAFALGNVLGWSSVAIPNLDKNEDFPDLDKDQKTWIASLTTVGAIFAAAFASFSLQRFGRKITIIGTATPFTFGWILLALASNVPMIYCGRFLTGFAGGVYPLAVGLYVTETAESSIRGRLGNSMVLFLVSGTFFAYVVGAFVSYVWLSLICAAFPIALMFLFSRMPETPRYLVSKGRHEEARRSLRWLRGARIVEEIEPELKEIIVSVEESNAKKMSLKDLMVKATMLPIAICLGLMFFQQFGGINAVLFYTVDIFESAGTTIDSNLSTMIVGFTQIVAVLISVLLVDIAGRKILLVVSESGLVISLSALGYYFYLKHQNNDVSPDGLGWLPLTSLIFFIISFNIAMSSIPWTMLGELLPSHIVGVASPLASGFTWLLAFIVTKTFEDMSNTLGVHGCYFLFAGFSFVGALFSLFLVPETKGKSLEEIQKHFSK